MVVWTKVAGISGAAAVALGAIGAHAMKDRSPEMKAAFTTGAHYHLVHSVALAAAALNMPKGKKKNLVCGLWLTGIVLFSGSCYAVGAANQRKPYSLPAPVGGLALIGGWLVLGLMA